MALYLGCLRLQHVSEHSHSVEKLKLREKDTRILDVKYVVSRCGRLSRKVDQKEIRDCVFLAD